MGSPSPAVPASQKLPSPGEWYSPSIERLMANRIEWAVSNVGAISPQTKRGLEVAGIRVFVFDIRGWEEIFTESERFLGTVLGEAAPTSWITDRKRLAGYFSGTTSFTFIAFVWGDPAILFGRRTFLSRLIEKLGGKNLVPAHVPLDYPQLSKEWIMKQKPDRVFVFDEFLRGEDPKKMLSLFWKSPLPYSTVVPAQYFGRSSFTPLSHLEKIAGGRQ